MNIQIFNVIKDAVLNILNNYKQKINRLDQKPKTQINVLMERFEYQTKTNNRFENEKENCT